MQYIGLQNQIWKNNFRSVLLLLAFPALMLSLLWIFVFLTSETPPVFSEMQINEYGEIIYEQQEDFSEGNLKIMETNKIFWEYFPWVTSGVFLWFILAYLFNASMINSSTSSKPLERKENMKIYNLLENLCISVGMRMPKLNIIDDDSLNAFASGINDRTYTISLSKGIIEKLNDEELETVIAHELTHIRNRDVRLLVISIIFVGIFSFLAEVFFRIVRSGGSSDRKGNQIIIVAMILALVGYLFSALFKFALSRKREYLADAGAAELTKNPKALASALRKISQDPLIEAVKNKDVAQMFIDNPQPKKNLITFTNNLFTTHPPINDRIKVLEQF